MAKPCSAYAIQRRMAYAVREQYRSALTPNARNAPGNTAIATKRACQQEIIQTTGRLPIPPYAPNFPRRVHLAEEEAEAHR